ncbi:hypothetical protein AQI95_21160 [Streptomyces yokosukanensis]|uniref:Helix-turn-helix domain-containing protein n=1 Tax=Streptomyces yokosukanensis TaxID=67386 RepID=A0A101P2Z5_9ACTN|nr:hypothetical protein [Streptomyces yokosukanensis]KUN03951.1 hypothetical protein AQI95_21160 [Streptomyces yokosukanensis]
MSATPARRKVDALLQLAAGSTNMAAARAAGVSPGTIAIWKKDPEFAREMDALRQVVRREPFDAAAVMAAAEDVEERLVPPGPRVHEDGSVTVRVSIPSGTSPRKAERLTARAIARGLRAVREAES